MTTNNDPNQETNSSPTEKGMVERVSAVGIMGNVLLVAFKLFAGRVVMIADSMEATGLDDGEYSLGGQKVFVHGNLATLESGTIAGSATNLFDCLRQFMDLYYVLRSEEHVDKAYIGEGLYPQIVNFEVFNKVQEMLSVLPKWHDSKNIYYCKGLITDTTTGATLVARFATLVYYLRHKEHCISVNLNVMDYLAEYSANILLSHYNAQQAQTNKNEYKLKIEENKNIIASKQSQIKEYEKAIERAINMNIMQPKYFPTEKMEAVIKQNETVMNKLQTEITDLQTENTRMQNWLNGEQQFINTIKGVSDAKKQEMINQVIEKIEITKLEQHHFKIVVKNKIGVICNSWFDYSSKGHKLHVEQVFEDGRRFDLTQQINANKRFERIRYNGK